MRLWGFRVIRSLSLLRFCGFAVASLVRRNDLTTVQPQQMVSRKDMLYRSLRSLIMALEPSSCESKLSPSLVSTSMSFFEAKACTQRAKTAKVLQNPSSFSLSLSSSSSLHSARSRFSPLPGELEGAPIVPSAHRHRPKEHRRRRLKDCSRQAPR